MPSKPHGRKSGLPAQEKVRGKVFRTGGSLAVRLPKEFHLGEEDVLLTRVKEGVLISPLPAVATVAGWWATWKGDPDFMAEGRQQPALPTRDFDDPTS